MTFHERQELMDVRVLPGPPSALAFADLPESPVSRKTQEGATKGCGIGLFFKYIHTLSLLSLFLLRWISHFLPVRKLTLIRCPLCRW